MILSIEKSGLIFWISLCSKMLLIRLLMADTTEIKSILSILEKPFFASLARVFFLRKSFYLQSK